jgi:putative tricarboxylic transport membrane protein
MIGQFAEVAEGILLALQPLNLLFIIFGTFLGLFVGAVPGLSSPMAITVLIPLTYGLGPYRAMYILLGIYVGTKLGGSFAAIMVRTPGTPAGACTALDGHPMALKGDGDLALGYATLASSFGGLMGWLLLFVAAPLISLIAVKFTNADVAVIAFVGLIFVATLSRTSMVKGLMSVALGLLLSTVGIDPITGFARYTFDIPQLLGGFDFVAAMIGMFAISVVFSDLEEVYKPSLRTGKARMRFPSLKRFFQGWKALLYGTGWGAIMGPLPGVGSVGATWISYSSLKNQSKEPEKFGTGIPEGIMAPESANNMCTGGALIPMMTLGIPGDPSTAVMLGALLLHGFRPGPLFFGESPDLAYGIIGGMLLTNIMMGVLAIASIGFFVRVLGTRRGLIFPLVLIMAVVGSFATTNSMFSVWVGVGFGLVGYFLYKYGFSIPGVVLALILGPIIEENMRLALVIYRGSLAAFVSSIPSVIGLIAAVLVIGMEIRRAYKHPQKKSVV